MLLLFFFLLQIAITLLACITTFSGQLYFWRGYFFTSTQQLHFPTPYFFRAAAFFSFFRTATFLQHLFFHNSFFFRTKILQSSHLLRMRSSLWQLHFWAPVSPCLGKKYLKKSYFFKAGTSTHYQLFQKRYILEKANVSEKHSSTLRTFSGRLLF